ncbi:ribonuclease E inhibitor RraB [Pokkaliibacter sp. MBI-7]|uniref:ribonuclease E inhibitor RraB n=1 Tax=Pokkaliibacter sp. MBI-7 TaxID=3040600 RepID=UPI00244C7847|nr:ribonuclease E inhibitor RraB [Pokkaliibacter sp. MBI-7]MDH2436227.1 ribonuclease E inhibitor RraB [Pokkaliibacter sp. MBI-7]
MFRSEDFPNDENGDVLRRMRDSGDNFALPRDFEFTVVFATREAVQAFGDHFAQLGYEVVANESGHVPELPWDVTVVTHMLPTHAAITAFEAELQRVATPLGGRNDGWGCFEQ